MRPSGGEHRRGPGHFDHRLGHRHEHGFKADRRFGYGKYGFRPLRWTRSRWSNDYRCYFYWAPQHRCWFFYEPSFAYYVPVTYFREVYPEAAPAVAATVAPVTPVVQQQTTVVVTAPTSTAEPSPPEPVVPVAPAPTAVQMTKVGPGVP